MNPLQQSPAFQEILKLHGRSGGFGQRTGGLNNRDYIDQVNSERGQDGGPLGPGGLSGIQSPAGGQGPQIVPPTPSNQPPVPASPVGEGDPVPSVQGVTPGAIERRLGVAPASLQARGGAMPAPSEAARMTHQPNQMGPERSLLSSPLAGIQTLLATLQSRQQGQMGPQ